MLSNHLHQILRVSVCSELEQQVWKVPWSGSTDQLVCIVSLTFRPMNRGIKRSQMEEQKNGRGAKVCHIWGAGGDWSTKCNCYEKLLTVNLISPWTLKASLDCAHLVSEPHTFIYIFNNFKKYSKVFLVILVEKQTSLTITFILHQTLKWQILYIYILYIHMYHSIFIASSYR